ncbi:HAD family hydrolase [Salana multivorans]
MAIETVVFDLGGVLVVWDPLSHPTLPTERVAELIEASGFRELNLRADAGETWVDLAAEVARRAPGRPELAEFIADYPRAFPATLTGLVPGAAELVEELREAGVRLLGLTNWSAETYPHGVAAAPVISRLESVLVSGEVGLAKPNPAIFHLLAERYDLDPAGTLFIDDSPANVEAARSVGFQAHHFTGTDRLRTELVELGVLR